MKPLTKDLKVMLAGVAFRAYAEQIGILEEDAVIGEDPYTTGIWLHVIDELTAAFFQAQKSQLELQPPAPADFEDDAQGTW